jgi:hypothetical protein
MDSCVSIADIEGKLTTRTAPTGVAAAMKKGKPKAKAKKKKVPKTGAAKGKKTCDKKAQPLKLISITPEFIEAGRKGVIAWGDCLVFVFGLRRLLS